MTASELIKQLQALPRDTKIVIRGYEDGYNDILELKPVKIKLKPNAYWFDEEFENNTNEDAINAVNLYGQNKNPKDDL